MEMALSFSLRQVYTWSHRDVRWLYSLHNEIQWSYKNFQQGTNNALFDNRSVSSLIYYGVLVESP